MQCEYNNIYKKEIYVWYLGGFTSKSASEDGNDFSFSKISL